MKKKDLWVLLAIAGAVLFVKKGGFAGLGDNYMHHVRGSGMAWPKWYMMHGKRGCCISDTDM